MIGISYDARPVDQIHQRDPLIELDDYLDDLDRSFGSHSDCNHAKKCWLWSL